MGRYDSSPIRTHVSPGPDGRNQESRYLGRRWLPARRRVVGAAVHTVTSGDRLDLIAHTYLGDPLGYWYVVDANGVIDPFELVGDAAEGRQLLIPLPIDNGEGY